MTTAMKMSQIMVKSSRSGDASYGMDLPGRLPRFVCHLPGAGDD